MSRTILIVEDNPITRKMLRLALESEGYFVLEAGDGQTALETAGACRPDLLVLDYVLPDTDGLQLLAEIRSRAAAPELPAVIVTGMVSRLDDLRAQGGLFTQVLAKPVGTAQLSDIVRVHFAAPERRGGGRRVLLVDDEPVNRKLAAVRLAQAGYAVVTAAGGTEGLERARANPPDAILSDVLMPGMDGFAFCSAARRDPRLADIPIVLVSSAYVEKADRDLARKMGANALVVRSADLESAIAALEEGLRGATSPAPAREVPAAALHQERLQVQLERQTARNEILLRQAAIQAAALSIMRGLSEALGQRQDLHQVIGDVLVHTLDAAGLSTGLLYLVEPAGHLRLQTHFGISAGAKADGEVCFGHPGLLRRILAAGQPVALSRRSRAGAETRSFLSRLGHSSALIVPLVVLGDGFGELVLASDSQDLSESSWLAFAASLALQFGQTVALGQSLTRLAVSEERYRALMEQAYDAILILDAGHRLVEANAQAELLFGERRADLIGRDMDDFTLPHERVTEHQIVRADGSQVPVEVSSSVVRVDGEPVVVAIVRDITERKAAAETIRIRDEQLRQAQRMEAVGQLAGGVAHDFNNVLTVIIGYGELVLDAAPPGDPQAARAEQILKAADQAVKLTRQLLAFSRKQVLQPQVVDLNAVVAAMETMLRRLIGEDVELVTVLDGGLGRVKADPGQIEQVLMNLAANARDAMPRGGRLTVETANLDLDAGYAGLHAGLEPGPYVMLAVSDSGHGMSPEILVHLFEPFFTTKEPGKGTGLGLATVHGIVKQSGGHVFVYSEPECGTTFKIFLPLLADVTVPAPAPALTAVTRPRGTETVLLVEDEESLRKLVRHSLEASGYTVIEARDSAHALDVIEWGGVPIQLLMTDVVMPGLSGRELAEQVAALLPEIKVLYTSGYTDDAIVRHGVLAESMAFLQKPFTGETLLRRVREVLDAPSG